MHVFDYLKVVPKGWILNSDHVSGKKTYGDGSAFYDPNGRLLAEIQLSPGMKLNRRRDLILDKIAQLN